MLETLTDIATMTAAFLALGAFVTYSLLSRWWTTRSGTAYWVLMLAMILFGGHYVAVAILGEPVPWRRFAVICLLIVAIGWNWATILWKQQVYHHRSSDDGEMDR